MIALAPALFVLIWSTGFIAARYAIVDADPQLFLLARMGLVALAMAGWAMAARDRWPRGRNLRLHLLAGALLPGLYLCGSWWAVQKGVPAGVMSLLGGVQPLAVALLALLVLRERLAARSWAGLAIGTLGVALVLLPAVGRASHAVPVAGAIVGIAAVLAMAGATMIQRSGLAADALAPAVAVQNLAGTAVALIALPLIGRLRWHDSALLWGTMAWSVLALSAAALTLLSWMLRHRGAAAVSALLLLVPPIAAIEARLLFGEHLSWVQIAGFATALGGVLLARARPAREGIEPG